MPAEGQELGCSKVSYLRKNGNFVGWGGDRGASGQIETKPQKGRVKVGRDRCALAGARFGAGRCLSGGRMRVGCFGRARQNKIVPSKEGQMKERPNNESQ